ADLEGARSSKEEGTTSAAGAVRQDREAPDLPAPVDEPVQRDPAQASDMQRAQADLDAANSAAQETEEVPDDGVASQRGAALPLEKSGAEESQIRSTPLDDPNAGPDNDTSGPEDQANDSSQTDGAKEKGEDESTELFPPRGDEEGREAVGAYTKVDSENMVSANQQQGDPLVEEQPAQGGETAGPQQTEQATAEASPDVRDAPFDHRNDDDDPANELSLGKELVPERRISPPARADEADDPTPDSPNQPERDPQEAGTDASTEAGDTNRETAEKDDTGRSPRGIGERMRQVIGTARNRANDTYLGRRVMGRPMEPWQSNRRLSKELKGQHPEPNATVADLQDLGYGNPSIAYKETNAKSRGDKELIQSVFAPRDGQYISTSAAKPGEIGQGNHRARQLMERAADPKNTEITWDTPIFIHRVGR
ncbi:hypothetical protein ACWGCP_15370, partial [Streptomyces niveus]